MCVGTMAREKLILYCGLESGGVSFVDPYAK